MRSDLAVTGRADGVASAEYMLRSALQLGAAADRLSSSLDVTGGVTVDLIAGDQQRRGWTMVLVERGPWLPNAVVNDLERVQLRLHSCLAAALDGLVAQKFPGSVGEPLVIRLDAFNTPNNVVKAFFERFSSEVLELPAYARALSESKFVSGVTFELNLSDSPNRV